MRLKNLTNLTELDWSYNKIVVISDRDVSVLRSLKNLQVLNLGYNNISDISALENLTNLQTLDLSFNNISDISALKNLA